MTPSTAWQLRPGPPLLWRTWKEHSLVFDPVTGDTHWLDLVAAEALRCLERQPGSTGTLCRSLAARLDVPEDDALAGYVAAFLERCGGLGLVEEASP